LYRTGRYHPDWYFHEINTGDDHVHILMKIPPKYAISSVVQKLKQYSSHELKKRYKFIDQIYEKGNMWSTGYFVSTVGLNEETIRRYIERQNIADRGKEITGEFS